MFTAAFVGKHTRVCLPTGGCSVSHRMHYALCNLVRDVTMLVNPTKEVSRVYLSVCREVFAWAGIFSAQVILVAVA
jgi:hypothetical protein